MEKTLSYVDKEKTQMKNLGILSLLIFICACTPKVTEQVVDLSSTPVGEVDKRCFKFTDLPNSQAVIESHVLYRDFIRNNDFDNAYPLWKIAYEAAPAADGRRDFHFTDGIKIYNHKRKNTTDSTLVKAYMDTIDNIYMHWMYCSDDKGYVLSNKGFDFYFEFRDYFDDEEIFNILEEAVSLKGPQVPYYVINPFTDLVVKGLNEGYVTESEARKHAEFINERIKAGITSGVDQEAWQIIKEYAPLRLEVFEGIEGFFDCAYYVEKYYTLLNDNPDDCEVINDIYGKLRWAKCEETNEYLAAVKKVRDEKNCEVELAPALSESGQAVKDLKEGRFREAVKGFERLYESDSDPHRKAEYALLISKVYYGQLKDFPLSRTWALRAAGHRAKWGEPYMLIGKLYASSGPLCGPGVGFESQVVTWPAIDKWNYAKSIDAGVTAEANRLINTYSQYMPSREDIFFRSLKENDSFKVGCWIQETTTIRTAK